MEADSREAVIRHIQSLGQVAIRADEVQAAAKPAERGRWFTRSRLSQKEITAFTMELSILLQAGLPLDRSLQITAEVAERPEVRRVISDIYNDVRGGGYLSDAMEAREGAFSPFYVNMIRAGEAGSALGLTLEQLAEFLEHSRAVQESVVSKLIYPIILVLLAGVSVLLLLTYVIPQFSELFAEAGARLPWITRVVIAAGELATNYGWLGFLALIFAALVFRRQYSDPRGRAIWDRRLLGLPLVGDLLMKLETARFTRTLGTLLGNGVPLLQAVTISREIVVNRAVADSLYRVIPALKAGQGLTQPLSEAALFPELAIHLVRVGEESGRLEAMLRKVSQIFEREVETAVNRILVLLEPALILGLGLLVAGIIMSILAAILSANELVF